MRMRAILVNGAGAVLDRVIGLAPKSTSPSYESSATARGATAMSSPRWRSSATPRSSCCRSCGPHSPGWRQQHAAPESPCFIDDEGALRSNPDLPGRRTG